MGPLDYTSPFDNLPAPGASLLQGVQGGATLAQMQLERQQKAVAFQQAQQQRDDLAALSKNPTPQAIASVMLKYPALSEQLKRGADVVSSTQQQGRLDGASQVYAALQSNAPDVALNLLKDQATAARNSGSEQDAKAAETMAQLVKDHPEFAKTTIGLRLAAAVGPEKFAESFAKLGGEQRAQELQGDAVRKGKADADAAVSGADSAKSKAVSDAVDAKYADQTALLKLEGIRTDNQYKRDQTKIAYLNARIAREGNELQRQKLNLELQKATTERDEKVRGRVADAESGAASIDNMLNNIERILSVATDKSGKPTALLRAAAGPLDSRLPTMQGDVADLEALVETLGAQAFLSQIPNIKGMGALSNAEGEKLQSAFQNFSLKQSPDQIVANLRDAKRLLGTGRGAISKRYGVALPSPDTPAAPKPEAALPSGWTVTER